MTGVLDRIPAYGCTRRRARKLRYINMYRFHVGVAYTGNVVFFSASAKDFPNALRGRQNYEGGAAWSSSGVSVQGQIRLSKLERVFAR